MAAKGSSPGTTSHFSTSAIDEVRSADAILVTAGAGMGVDSGLPDFRGNEGFWKAYPPYKERGLNFYEMANPSWFDSDPHLALGFYGHRLSLYENTVPHQGFEILRQLIETKSGGGFVFTSNVDGQFQAARFDPDRVMECHGSIHHWQCAEPCHDTIYKKADLDSFQLRVNEKTFLAEEETFPRCPKGCGSVMRPNILMFGDYGWISERTGMQDERFRDWWREVQESKVVIIECGAGTAVPTIRNLAGIRRPNHSLIRINPREPEIHPRRRRGDHSMATGALEALLELQAALDE